MTQKKGFHKNYRHNNIAIDLLELLTDNNARMILSTSVIVVVSRTIKNLTKITWTQECSGLLYQLPKPRKRLDCSQRERISFFKLWYTIINLACLTDLWYEGQLTKVYWIQSKGLLSSCIISWFRNKHFINCVRRCCHYNLVASYF